MWLPCRECLAASPRSAALLTQDKDFGESNVEAYARGQRWLDGELAGGPFIAGDMFGMADICALSTVDFAAWISQPIDPERKTLRAWHERVSARPSASA